MPYKDINKQREANRKSYRKYSEARNRAIVKYRKKHPKKFQQFKRDSGWNRQGIRNDDGTQFRTRDYYKLLKQQNKACAIYSCPEKPANFKRIFDVDHDHQTGIVRGLLCANHNKVLGKVNDSIDQLQRLINYLKLHKSGGEKQL